jgi:phosphatidylinositol alpha-1,6-mannosyltransferase
VIVPPVPDLTAPSEEQKASMRQRLGIGVSAPLFVYPGDLELSRGAERVAEVVEPLKVALPDAVVVFAYRAKTEGAAARAQELKQKLDPKHVRVVSELDNVLHLVASASALLFPVEDLWGKVDLPIVVLEAMALGVPVVAPNSGPLDELEGVVKVAVDRPAELAQKAQRLYQDSAHRQQVIVDQRSYVEAKHRAAKVSAAYQDLYLELLRGASRAIVP